MCPGAIALPGLARSSVAFSFVSSHLCSHSWYTVATAGGCVVPGTTATLQTQFVVVLQVVTLKGFQFPNSGVGEVGCQGCWLSLMRLPCMRTSCASAWAQNAACAGYGVGYTGWKPGRQPSGASFGLNISVSWISLNSYKIGASFWEKVSSSKWILCKWTQKSPEGKN